MVLQPDQARVHHLLTEAIKVLCKSGLTYTRGFTVEGLLGITLHDTDQVFLINIKESILGPSPTPTPKLAPMSTNISVKQEPSELCNTNLKEENEPNVCDTVIEEVNKSLQPNGEDTNDDSLAVEELPQETIRNSPTGMLQAKKGSRRRKGTPVQDVSGLGTESTVTRAPEPLKIEPREEIESELSSQEECTLENIAQAEPGEETDQNDYDASMRESSDDAVLTIPFLQKHMAELYSNSAVSFDPAFVNPSLVNTNPAKWSPATRAQEYRMRMKLLHPEKWADHKRKQAERMRQRRQTWSKERLDREREKSRERMRRRRQVEQMSQNQSAYFQQMYVGGMNVGGLGETVDPSMLGLNVVGAGSEGLSETVTSLNGSSDATTSGTS